MLSTITEANECFCVAVQKENILEFIIQTIKLYFFNLHNFFEYCQSKS